MQELLDTVRVASGIARGAPAAIVAGRHVVARWQWPAQLVDAAQALGRRTLEPGVVVEDPLARISAVLCPPHDGAPDAVLVVAAIGLDLDRQSALAAAAQIVGVLGGANVARLLERLQSDEPDAALARDLRNVMCSLSYNIQRAAALFGLSRPTLYRRLENVGVPIRRIPAGAREDRW